MLCDAAGDAGERCRGRRLLLLSRMPHAPDCRTDKKRHLATGSTAVETDRRAGFEAGAIGLCIARIGGGVDLAGVSPEEPIEGYLARHGQQYEPLSHAEMRKFSGTVATCSQAAWSGAKGLRTGCPLILFRCRKDDTGMRTNVSLGLAGKPPPRPCRWAMACAEMTISVGLSGGNVDCEGVSGARGPYRFVLGNRVAGIWEPANFDAKSATFVATLN